MVNRALCIDEHPWQNRRLPRRPTRLVAVPPVRPREFQSADGDEPLGLWGQPPLRLLQTAAHSVAFLLLLVSVLGGVWALSLF
jgi:hypothetical protein